MKIRTATFHDTPALADLARRTFLETFHHYDETDLARFLAAHCSDEVFASYLNDPQNRLWVVESGGIPIAYAKLGAYKLPLAPDVSPVIELHRIYVLKAWKGKGIGAALMEEVFAEARTQQVKAMYLGVWEKNIAAQQFYARYGFEKAGEYDYLPIGRVVDREWILRKIM